MLALSFFWTWVEYRRDFDRFILRSLNKKGKVVQGKVIVTFLFDFPDESNAKRFARHAGKAFSAGVYPVSSGYRCEVSRSLPARVFSIKRARLWLSFLAFLWRGSLCGTCP